MTLSDLENEILMEFRRAQAAREVGNEGKARVCARRAAGMAVRRYLQERSIPVQGKSAFELLRAFGNLPDIEEKMREAAGHLTRRVDEAFQIPGEVDLVAEAEFLCEALHKL